MHKKNISIAIMAVLLHTIFIILSFDTSLLSSSRFLVDPVAIERIIMLLQFLPLLLVLTSAKLSRSTGLLFLSFAICISTLFIVDDFNTGFYGAMIDNNSNTMPRMRASAHLMAYEETGRLAILDYHGEYFLEFILVHFLSRVSGLNNVFTYFFIVRLLAIILWSVLFVWSGNTIAGSRRTMWLFLLASSIMLASQSYNHEISFGPALLLFFYLVAQKQRCRSSTLTTFMIAVAIMLTSFRETQLLGSISLIAAFMILWKKTGDRANPGLPSLQISFGFMIVTLSLARTFLWTSAVYPGTYIHWFSALINSALAMFREGISLQQPLLTTLEGVQNPIDKAITPLSVFFAVGFLVIIALLLARLVTKRILDRFSLAISLVFIIALSIPLSAYGVEKIVGAGPIRDFGSATALVRSLTPLAVLMIPSYSRGIRKGHFPFKKMFSLLIMVCLSLNLVFSPFLFLRKEAKSTYDMLQISGDMSEYTILGNHLYGFVTSHISTESKIRILSPETGFLQHYDLLPLRYKLGRNLETGSMNLTLESRVYDNSIFTGSTSVSGASTIFLNELELAAHW